MPSRDLDVPSEMILNFLETQDSNIRERYEEFRRQELSDDEIRMTSLDRGSSGEEKELFPLIMNAEIGSHQISSGNVNLAPMDFYYSTGVCHFITKLSDIQVVSPNGGSLDKTFTELYAKEILDNPEAFWDIYYEMETLNSLETSGLDVYPIDESAVEANGADILIDQDDDDFWVECKNKRSSTAYEWELERLSKQIADSVWRDHNLRDHIGDDSFVVEISSPEDFSDEILNNQDKRNSFIDLVSEKVAEIIENRGSSFQVSFEDYSLEVELIDYYEGRREVELTDEQLQALSNRGAVENFLNPFGHLDFDVDTIEGNGHATPYIERVEDSNTVQIFNTCVFSVDIPWNIPYHDWVYSTVSDAVDQHPDQSNLIVYTKIPLGVIKQMMNEDTSEPNHNGEIVKKWKRLQQKIIGIFNRTNRVKAVVLTTDFISIQGNNRQLRSLVKPLYNENVEEEIPDGLVERLENQLQIEDYVENTTVYSIPRDS
jgi:hypothetical protein